MANKIYQNDIGTVILIDMGEDITGATFPVSISVRKGEGTLTTWTVTEAYETQYLRYVTVEDDLDEVGEYYLQPNMEIDDWTGKGETVNFHVYAAWE